MVEIVIIQSILFFFQFRPDANFLLIGPMVVFCEKHCQRISKGRRVRERQPCGDVLDRSRYRGLIWNIETQTNTAMFVAVVRPNYRVFPVSTETQQPASLVHLIARFLHSPAL